MPLDQRAAKDIVHSACPHDCPSTCALDIERLDARTIGRVYGADNPYTAGVICAKVARYAERVHHPERLTKPLRRVGEKGCDRRDFAEISWDDALDIVAERLIAAADRHGSEAVWPYFYAGTMGLVQRDGIHRLRHVMRYSGQHETICNMLSTIGWLAGTGAKYGVDPMEIGESDLIVVWGCNAVHTQVNLMTHITRARKHRGAQLVVVDPYRNATAQAADMHLMIQPGTDGALACAVMHVLFRDGYADRDYMARFTDAPGELEDHLEPRTPEWAAAITGIPAREIEEFADLYGRTKRSFLRLGYGFTRSRNGAVAMHAASCLPAVTGAWQYKGGGALHSNGGLFGVDKTLIEGLDRRDPSIRVLDMSRIGPVLNGDPADVGNGPPVTAMFIQNTNPMVVAPDSNAVRRGFAREDLFVCVHEQFLTETARMADIVLPATTFLEHDDMYQGGGHTYLQVTKKVIEPVGGARCNHDVLCGLAQRLGADHPGFEMTPWQLIETALEASGYPPAETVYQNRWHNRALPFRAAHYLDGFAHADGKFHFRPNWESLGPNHHGMPSLPDHFDIIDRTDPDHPFRLVTAPSRQYLNTSFTETPTSETKEGRPTAQIHPADSARLGLAEGDRVRIGNRLGSVVVIVRPMPGLREGTVVTESIWPNAAFEEGIGINALVSAEPGWPNGGAVFHDTAVWLRPA